MNPEIKQQLYGGEITDYYTNSNKNNSPEKDLKNIGAIYQQIANKNNPLNLPAKQAQKIQITKNITS